ncbi:general transcription factor IIF subunit 1-like [Paramacrobiotus metropolitanus]|uniref:general transcription factor IIF subunit 1-like n=1 Tax=Paramacrobiotus metropolitanus TaxID=2943436 RepID=UPI00244565A2|nr:general transcription factor IIF subunit 1-like [Paramacrobiotus metropolitanus]
MLKFSYICCPCLFVSFRSIMSASTKTPATTKPPSNASTPASSQSQASGSSMPSSQSNANTKTFELRVPKKHDRKVFVAKFSNTLGIDFATWKKNAPEFAKEKRVTEDVTKTEEDEKAAPKVGAGSEFGKEKRDEARKRRFTRRAGNEDSPWIMTDTSSQKKYKGTREGGVQDNSSYYVFSTTGGVIEAYPISEWYTFVPVQRYKALDAEEAEEAFGKRDKVFNYFNLMYKKRLGKNEEGKKKEPAKEVRQPAGLFAVHAPSCNSNEWAGITKISDGDDDLMPGEMSDSDEEGAAGDTEAISGDAKKGKKGKAKPKKEPKKSRKHKEGDEEDGEPAEESDDGDYEDREVDYESSAESEVDDLDRALEDIALKGVDEEVAEMEDDDDDDEEKEEGEKDKADGTGDDNAGSESDNEEEDFDAMADSVLPAARKIDSVETVAGAASGSGSATRITKEPQGVASATGKGKRKLESESPATASKRGKGASGPATTPDGKLEAYIRSYLIRKPLTSKELLKKLVTKHGIRPEDLKSRLGEIIKRLNPEKTNINGKLYMHLKS